MLTRWCRRVRRLFPHGCLYLIQHTCQQPADLLSHAVTTTWQQLHNNSPLRSRHPPRHTAMGTVSWLVSRRGQSYHPLEQFICTQSKVSRPSSSNLPITHNHTTTYLNPHTHTRCCQCQVYAPLATPSATRFGWNHGVSSQAVLIVLFVD